MPVKEATPITRETVFKAANNYERCLALPAASQILIVSDKLPQQAGAPVDPHLSVRRQMTDRLANKLSYDYPIVQVAFDHSMSRDDLRKETSAALTRLDENGEKKSIDRTTTVVYLADAWLNRSGMYEAFNSFAEVRTPGKVRVAGSLGFKTGDARVMSQMGLEQQEKMVSAQDYYAEFFKANPRGTFEVTSRDINGNPHDLTLHLDTSKGKAPFQSEIGIFDENNQVFIGKYVYLNIPGGETYGTPYPYHKTEGEFAAEGVVFSVKNGLLYKADVVEKGAEERLMARNQDVLKMLREGRTLPIAELGIGFYAIAGIPVYTDSSTLSREKAAPHIGMGHGFESPESGDIEKAAGDFHHSDAVMDESTVITFQAPNSTEKVQFYPPLAA